MPLEPVTSLISSIAQDAKCTTGADGVCVLTTTGGKVQLTNVVLGEDAQPVTLKNVAASKDIRVIPRERRWRSCFVRPLPCQESLEAVSFR